MIQSFALLFLVGATLGTLGDFGHVLSKTLDYPNPYFPLPFSGQPLWVPFLFGFASLSIGSGRPLIDKIVNQTFPKYKEGSGRVFQKTSKLTIASAACLVFLGLYLMSGYLPLEPIGFRDGVLAFGALGLWFFLDKSAVGFAYGILIALAGCIVEKSLTILGLFYYLPEVAPSFGIPTWLPWLYFAASVSVGQFGKALLNTQKLSSTGP